MNNVKPDIAYDFLRKRILSGEYPAGHVLLTEKLATAIGVSRTPIRDSLRQLELDGLVTIQARVGACVKRMDIKEFREMCELRLALESYAANLAALNRTEAELLEIQFPLESQRRLTKRLSDGANEDNLLGEVVREDVNFHIAIINAAKNEVMKKEIFRLHLVNRVVAGPTAPDEGKERLLSRPVRDRRRRQHLRCHEAIYRAIKNLDGERAKVEMEKHMQNTINLQLKTLAGTDSGVLLPKLSAEVLNYTV